MNRIDVFLAILLALFALRGFWRGFSREFFGFVGLIGGLVVAGLSYAQAVPYVPPSVPESMRPIASFVAIFVAFDLVAKLAGALVHRLLGALFLSPVNRIAGALFGAMKGAAMAGIVLLLVQVYVPAPVLGSELDQSRLAAPLLDLAGEIRGHAPSPPPRRQLPPVPQS